MDSESRDSEARCLKVFLAHAAEDSKVAEQVRIALVQDGHEVFLDQTELDPAAGRVHRQIRKKLLASDLLIFFVSRHSLREGKYTLTELELFEKRFSNPTGRVLMAELEKPVADTLPAYLSGLPPLRTRGNWAAKVAAEVEKLARLPLASDPQAESAEAVPSGMPQAAVHGEASGASSAGAEVTLADVPGVPAEASGASAEATEEAVPAAPTAHGPAVTPPDSAPPVPDSEMTPEREPKDDQKARPVLRALLERLEPYLTMIGALPVGTAAIGFLLGGSDITSKGLADAAGEAARPDVELSPFLTDLLVRLGHGFGWLAGGVVLIGVLVWLSASRTARATYPRVSRWAMPTLTVAVILMTLSTWSRLEAVQDLKRVGQELLTAEELDAAFPLRERTTKRLYGWLHGVEWEKAPDWDIEDRLPSDSKRLAASFRPFQQKLSDFYTGLCLLALLSLLATVALGWVVRRRYRFRQMQEPRETGPLTTQLTSMGRWLAPATIGVIALFQVWQWYTLNRSYGVLEGLPRHLVASYKPTTPTLERNQLWPFYTVIEGDPSQLFLRNYWPVRPTGDAVALKYQCVSPDGVRTKWLSLPSLEMRETNSEIRLEFPGNMVFNCCTYFKTKRNLSEAIIASIRVSDGYGWSNPKILGETCAEVLRQGVEGPKGL